MIPAIIAAIPSLIKLFNSDSRSDGVKELTQTVVQEAGKKLGINFNTKEDVSNHLNANPVDAIKLKELDDKYKLSIDELYLKDKSDARKMNVLIQQSKDWLVRNAGSLIAIFVVVSTFGLWLCMLIGMTDSLNQSVLMSINSSLTLSLGYVLSFYYGSSKTEADSKRA